MKIQSIQPNFNQQQMRKQPNFKQLRLQGDAPFRLVQSFQDNPTLKEKFIQKILLPLKECKVDVIFDGCRSLFREPKDNFYKEIFMVFDNEYRVVPVEGPLVNVREVFRPYDKSVPHTNEFNEEYFLKEIEAAKNIALHLQDEKGIDVPLKEVEPIILESHPFAKDVNELLELCGQI